MRINRRALAMVSVGAKEAGCGRRTVRMGFVLKTEDGSLGYEEVWW